ncbi:MBL fold metallo-hydrolase [Aureibacter tunicatorum]|uniref:Glyoxylase-like metal-dependent hydrolase (Beta-lactamase superfamily II) n=1 Tax=Aureibacter tunicatorum TaxID=866807 RepID=A0AAE4BVB9_9BACT|nr:MBL fold metallo-hydrolase [Aureibacter tunicatorum]MDR6241603.1 glyoxylase-like metal-dependent hydrolase (beta-lactamase superfamily II) [Aureibacter tunicatorum]BDD07173.1 hypothetical protein AUTU_46560 [Aureibacter tunicatorum]
MNRKDFIKISSILGLSSTSIPNAIFGGDSEDREFYASKNNGIFNPDLYRIRQLSTAIPGELPKQINVLKVADALRKASIVLKGGDPHRIITLARTAYQIQYPKGSIMLDSGMDLETHREFTGEDKYFYNDNFQEVNKALLKANMIIFSHYHADHVAGVVRSPHFDTLAPKTWASKSTADMMYLSPHKPSVNISQENVNKFIIGDFANYYPLAPGIVAFKAPGHTPDSKMFYLRLQNGKEFIHSIDSGWTMENIRNHQLKNAPWVIENADQLIAQYDWLNRLMESEKNITILCSHDNEQYEEFRRKKILGSSFV